MDENDLARFIDGTLSDEERAGAVAHLSASEADAELLADAAYLLRDLEAAEGAPAQGGAESGHPHTDDADTGRDPKVVPLRPPSTERRWRRAPARWLALAAVLAGVLLVPLALSRRGPADAGEFAALLASRQAGLPAGWTDERPWRVTRGGAGDPLTEEARAARLGALHVDLELAAAGRDAEQTQLLAAQIEQMLGAVPGSGTVVPTYRQIAARAGQPPENVEDLLEEGRETVAMFVDEELFRLGAWAEAARIAARSRDAAFFRARASRKMLDRAAEMPALDQESRASVEAIRAAAREDPPDWTALAAHTNQLLGQIGG